MNPNGIRGDSRPTPSGDPPALEVQALSKRYSAGDRDRYAAVRPIFRRDRNLELERAGSGAEGSDGDDDDDELEQDGEEIVLPAGGDRRWALEELTFSVEPGSTFAVLGELGAGKSTLLRILAGLAPPTRGHAVVRGRVGPTLELGALFARKDVGPLENARQLTRLVGVPRGLREGMARRAFELAFPTTRELRSTSPKAVLRRIFTAVAVDPYFEVILLDEALPADEPAFNARLLEQLIESASKGAAILLATDEPNLVESLCPRAMWIDLGRIAALGESSQVLEAYRQRNADETTVETGTDDEPIASLAAVSVNGDLDSATPDVSAAPSPRGALRGFNANVALLDVAIAASPAGPPYNQDAVITYRVEVARPGISTLCALRLVRDDGWRRLIGQKQPIPALDPGIYEIVLRLPSGAVGDGEYVADALIKVRSDAKKALIGRRAAFVLQVDETGAMQFSGASEGLIPVQGTDESDYAEPPLAVSWTLCRLAD